MLADAIIESERESESDRTEAREQLETFAAIHEEEEEKKEKF